MTGPRHYLEGNEIWPMDVKVIGCGGNGAQIVSGLAAIEIALNQIGERSLRVTVYDDDVVTTANIGRQPFFPCDIGRSKSDALVERINMAYGFDWISCPAAITSQMMLPGDLIISCVDTIKARQDIYKAIVSTAHRHHMIRYWLDLGNSEFTGQAILGKIQRNRSRPQSVNPHLPHFFEVFPHLLKADVEEDNTPSCSLAEALKRQSLFINRTLAAHALSMLYELLVMGSVGSAGIYLNLKTNLTVAMPIQPAKSHKKKTRKALKTAT